MASHFASRFLEPRGLLLLTGALSIFEETHPEMLSYAISKTGVHYLAKSLSEDA